MSDRRNDACWASCNVLLVLGILADGERAGHEIITILERQCDRTFAGHEGDLYPLLHRLEERGDIRRPAAPLVPSHPSGDKDACAVPPRMGALPPQMQQSGRRR